MDEVGSKTIYMGSMLELRKNDRVYTEIDRRKKRFVSRKILSVEELETPPAATQPGVSGHRSPRRERFSEAAVDNPS